MCWVLCFVPDRNDLDIYGVVIPTLQEHLVRVVLKRADYQEVTVESHRVLTR